MGIPVFILGESGSGKSYSIKNLDPASTGIFSVEKGRLPFKKKFNVAKNATYAVINDVFKSAKLKRYIIDDSQYLLVNELFDTAKQSGYGKFTDMALHFRNLIHHVNHKMPDDCIVYFLHHTETDSTSGRIKAKTVGKMLDEKLTLEGCFDIVLCTTIEGGEHYFVTQSDGTLPAKSPEGMFANKIPNDLNLVDEKIREYYGLNEESEESADEET